MNKFISLENWVMFKIENKSNEKVHLAKCKITETFSKIIKTFKIFTNLKIEASALFQT